MLIVENIMGPFRINEIVIQSTLETKKKTLWELEVLPAFNFFAIPKGSHSYKEYPTHQTVCSELPIVGTNSPK